jgi:hypothetical protein
VGSTGVTIAALVAAWANTHSGWFDTASLVTATAAAMLADVPRLREMSGGEDDDSDVVVLSIVFGWLFVSVALMVYGANTVSA